MGQILTSLSPAYGGYSIARDEKVILIRGAVPGEVVEVEIEENRKDYAVGSVISVIEPSEHRIQPACSVFGRCGGCHLQFISYEKQLSMKDEILLDSLGRLGGLETALGPVLSGEPWHYRSRAQFKVSKSGDIGFFRAASRDVIGIESCPLMNAAIEGLFRKIREADILHNLSDLHIAAGDTPVALLRGRDYDRGLFEKFIESGLTGIAYNDGIAYGGAYTSFDLNGLKYTVSPWTFFQSHWALNTKVVEFIREKIMPLKGKRILDLYAGAGNFSLPLAVHAAEVIGVEENEYAVEDGKRNVELNDIRNCRIVRSSAEKYKISGKMDVIILDPPRPGLTSEVVRKVLDCQPERIVYISCNPATLARDLRKLKEKYAVESVQQVDFFPNTFHIEAVGFLTAR